MRSTSGNQIKLRAHSQGALGGRGGGPMLEESTPCQVVQTGLQHMSNTGVRHFQLKGVQFDLPKLLKQFSFIKRAIFHLVKSQAFQSFVWLVAI